MAEGVTADAPTEEQPEIDEEEECVATDTPAVEEQAVVRPKQREVLKEAVVEETARTTTGPPPGHIRTGNWWHSSALAGLTGARQAHTPSFAGNQFQGWRERQWVEEEEGDWSYSTGPGSTTMDILRDRFGEASFRDAPSWQPWAPNLEPSGSWQGGAIPGTGLESRPRLASPKFKLEPRSRREKKGEGSSRNGNTGTMLNDGGKGTLQPREERQRGGSDRQGRDRSRDEQQQQRPLDPLPMWAPGVWTPQTPWGLPPLQATFDGAAERVALFLSQVISHMDLYGRWYPSQWAMVVAVTAVLTSEAADWVADLHSEHARELTDLGLFLEALRSRFEDDTRTQVLEAELVALRQRGRPAKDYVKEFRTIAGKLRSWPERLLVHQFQTGLDRDIRQACVYRGLGPRLTEWYKAAVDLDVGLREFRPRGLGIGQIKRGVTRQYDGRGPVRPTSGPTIGNSGAGGRVFRCFRCNQEGHRAFECPLPPSRVSTPRALNSSTNSTTKERPGRTPERSRAANQSLMSETTYSPRIDSPGTARVPVDVRLGEDEEDSHDPMVSDPIRPFVVPVTIQHPGTRQESAQEALIDSGCTRCLIRRSLVDELGITIRTLKTPIRFEQADGTLLGGAPVTHVTEPIVLRIGEHQEKIRLIVIERMIEPIILGLAWLDKWEPVIWWEGGFRKIRLPIGRETCTGLQIRDETPRVGGSIVQQSGSEELFPAVYNDLSRVFSEEECNILPPHRDTDCGIELISGAKLPKPRMYAMSPREIRELREYIDKNLERGFIKPSRSRLAAPVLFREKKDGGLRLCVDYRGLNAVCLEPLYPLPLLTDLLTTLATGKIFTKLDLREAYYRVRIRPGDEWKTTFNCPLGSYHFLVMPFGLQGAPAVFMQFINGVLHEFLYRGVLVYLDDILIYTNTMEEHIHLVRQVLNKLLDSHLFVKLSKCEFHRTEIDYLGFRISDTGIQMDPKKVVAVLDWQAPRTRKQLQSFLGFANFYRRFIPSFAQVALPLTDLLRTKTLPVGKKPKPSQPLQWTSECQKAFETLKRLFAAEPILKHPDLTRPFIIQADASDVAVGAVLLQGDDMNALRPCAYTSRKFTTTERNWAVWEKEAYAVKWALQTWRHLLEGGEQPFEVWTDHKNLEALQVPRMLSPKQVRWAQYFQRFRFTLKYKPARKLFLADALSRMPQYRSKRGTIVQAMIPSEQLGTSLVATTTQQDLDWMSLLQQGLQTDDWLSANREVVTFREGLAWWGNRLYIPKSLREKVLQRCHDSKTAGHYGFLKTLHSVRRQFWWPRMRKEVETYVKGCHICATSKPRSGKPIGLLQQVADPTKPWEEISMDFIVDLPADRGHTVIWTVLDLFSRQAHFIPCRGLPTAQRLVQLFIQHVYRLHGVPKRIISDRGVQFTADFWRRFLRCIGTTQGLSSAYHPSTNGAAERANAMVERYLRSYVSYQQDNWVNLLPFAESTYNNTLHRGTGYTPFSIVSGMDFLAIPELDLSRAPPISPGDWPQTIRDLWPRVRTALQRATLEYQQQANKKRLEGKPFQVGDRVYLSTKYLRLKLPGRKLGPKYIGPFQIVKIINPVTVRLKLPSMLGKVHPVFHSSLLKPVVVSREQSSSPGPVVGDHYEITEILDSRYRRGCLHYLVRWTGYPDTEASWVPVYDLEAPKLVARFHKRHPHRPQ